MKSLVANLAAAARRRSVYRRTLAELQSMPLDVALDLDIYAGDARAIARRSVYGA